MSLLKSAENAARVEHKEFKRYSKNELNLRPYSFQEYALTTELFEFTVCSILVEFVWDRV